MVILAASRGSFPRFSGEFSRFSWQEVHSGSAGEILVTAAKGANTGLLFIYSKCPRCFGDFTHAGLKGEWDSLFYTMPFLKHNNCAGFKNVIFKSVTSLEVTYSLESNNFFICSHIGLVMDCSKAAATGSQSPEIRYQILNGDFLS